MPDTLKQLFVVLRKRKIQRKSIISSGLCESMENMYEYVYGFYAAHAEKLCLLPFHISFCLLPWHRAVYVYMR